MTICDEAFALEVLQCPRYFDDPGQTSCCPDSQGCCFPGAAVNPLDELNSPWKLVLHYVFMVVMVVILISAIFFLCCDTSESSCSRDDDEFFSVNQELRPIVFRTVTSEEEYDRTLRILGDRGELYATAPSIDYCKDLHYSSTIPDARRCPSYPTASLTSYHGSQLFEGPPPPYMETTVVNPDLSPLVLPAREDVITSSQSTSRCLYGETHPETSNQRPPPFVPR